MITIKDLKKYSASDWERIANVHIDWSKDNNRFTGNPEWQKKKGNISAIGIRFNDERDFNYGKWNDLLVLVYYPKNGGEPIVNYLTATTDPARFYNGSGNKIGRAHLRQGSWNSYHVRPHAWKNQTFEGIGRILRWALCQDKDVVEIIRTDRKGNKIADDKFKSRDFFGINIHNSPSDSSWGCTVTQHDKDYVKLMLPLLYDLKNKTKIPTNHDNITYYLINQKNLEQYIGEPVQAEAKDGETRRVGEAKAGILITKKEE